MNESIGLLHLDLFFKQTIEKCRLDIHLVQHEVVLRDDAQNDPDRRELGHRSERLLKVHAISLQKTFTTRQTLYRSMRPSTVSLILNTQLLLIALRLLDNGTSSHVLFLHND